MHECLNEDAKKKKGQILYITGWDYKITTSAKLLDITYKSYGFSAYLIEAITNEYQTSKAGFHRSNYSLSLYCVKTHTCF